MPGLPGTSSRLVFLKLTAKNLGIVVSFYFRSVYFDFTYVFFVFSVLPDRINEISEFWHNKNLNLRRVVSILRQF